MTSPFTEYTFMVKFWIWILFLVLYFVLILSFSLLFMYYIWVKWFSLLFILSKLFIRVIVDHWCLIKPNVYVQNTYCMYTCSVSHSMSRDTCVLKQYVVALAYAHWTWSRGNSYECDKLSKPEPNTLCIQKKKLNSWFKWYWI